MHNADYNAGAIFVGLFYLLLYPSLCVVLQSCCMFDDDYVHDLCVRIILNIIIKVLVLLLGL